MRAQLPTCEVVLHIGTGYLKYRCLAYEGNEEKEKENRVTGHGTCRIMRGKKRRMGTSLKSQSKRDEPF